MRGVKIMLIDVVRTKMYDAMKNKDKEKKEFYAFLLDKLMKAAKAKQNANDMNPTLSAEEEVAVVQSLVKQTRDAIRTVQSQKLTNDKAVQEANEFICARNAELALYEEFLPKQMTDEEIQAAILEAYNEVAGGSANKGLLMKQLMPKVKGKADGKRVAELADAFLRSL